MKRGIIIAIAVSVALSLPFYGAKWTNLMHILGAVMFMGNLMVSGIWVSMAKRSWDRGAITLAARGVSVADAFVTTPGVLLLVLNGGILLPPYLAFAWMQVSLGLFALAVLIWLFALVPLQGKILAAVEAGAEDPDALKSLFKNWFRWSGLATLAGLVTMFLMVFNTP